MINLYTDLSTNCDKYSLRVLGVCDGGLGVGVEEGWIPTSRNTRATPPRPLHVPHHAVDKTSETRFPRQLQNLHSLAKSTITINARIIF
jgi:hypothetical protein